MKNYIISLLIIAWCCTNIFAQQFDVNADIRTRYEMRNGYATLKSDTAVAANFITQRTRIILDYSSKNIKLRFSPQNVRVWGDVATTSKSDLNNSFHEAYGEVLFNKYLSLKVGRQEIEYDDARIFGNVDWSMQARSHDAALFKIRPDSNNTIHIGLALNANKESNFHENYLVGQYKTLQYLWYHGIFSKFGISLLFLNNGIPYLVSVEEKIGYSQTMGTRLTLNEKRLNADVSFYFQTGKLGLNKINAQNFLLNVTYRTTVNFAAGFGVEYLSGKSTNAVSSDITSFNPLYGTNHKFNGYMDYFYVANHLNTVGLTDVYLNAIYEKNKYSTKLTPHFFMSAANIYTGNVKSDNYLGSELDFTFGYNLFENVKIDVGYSQMFATSSLEVLKGGNKSNYNSWFYLSLKFNPKLFSYKPTVK